MRSYSLVAACLLFASCGTVDFATVDAKEFGPAPAAVTLQNAADQTLQDSLIDPESCRVRWFDQQPKQAASFNGWFRGGWVYGWGMRFGVNAKNRFGGYTGEKLYLVIKRGDKIYVDERGSDWFAVNDQPAAPVK